MVPLIAYQITAFTAIFTSTIANADTAIALTFLMVLAFTTLSFAPLHFLTNLQLLS